MTRTHGIASTYYHGCRCDLCQLARKAYQQQKPKYVPSDAAKAHKADYDRAKRRDKKKLRRAYLDSRKSIPCVDCELTFPPVCMDFDHVPERGPRHFWLSHWVHRDIPMRLLDAEIAKCDVVCACCHRLRTQARQKVTPMRAA